MGRWRIRSMVTCCLAALPTGTALADGQYPAQTLLSTSQTIVGEPIHYPVGPAKVTAAIITLASGETTPWHDHAVPMFAYLLDGELDVDYGAKGQRVYKAGDALVEAMTTTHRGTNQGETPVRILVVYMGAEGAQNVVVRNTPQN